MPHLRLYRLAFAPALLALVILAFSLEGVPAPAEPPPGTLEFDPEGAVEATKEVLALGDSRAPGSATDDAAADLVAERFSTVVAGSLAEQRVEATVDGEDVELRNVFLTLPGASDRAIVVVAARDSREGPGASASAAATGLLLELVDELAAAGRERTLVLASTSGASAGSQGARELLSGLPERTTVDAVVVISQPGLDEPYGPHLVTAAGGDGPSAGLASTAEEILRDRAGLSPGRIGSLAQIARYAIPAAAGEQAAFRDEGYDAIALSSAGELPLDPASGGKERLSAETLGRFGPTVLGLVAALDAAPGAPSDGPGAYLALGENLVPGWSVALLVGSLLLPPAALSASLLAEAHRRRTSRGKALAWAAEWWLPAVVVCIGVYGLGLFGVIPGSGVPYDPARFEMDVRGAAVIVLLLALSAWLWWVLGLRRIPAGPGPRGAGAASGLLCAGACFLVWLANPYLALVLLPLAHLVAVLGATGRRPAALAPLALAAGVVPLVSATVYVAATLDWGVSTPWQLAVLVAGGGFEPLQVLGGFLVAGSVAGVFTAALSCSRTRTSASDPHGTRAAGGVVPSENA